MKKILFIILMTLSPLLFAAKQSERWYQERWCAEYKGSVEVTLSDRTRVDCLTEAYAIEFDFGKKWYEAIGQSLGYSIETLKKPGI